MTDDVCVFVQNKLCVQNWISAACVCNCVYRLIPTKPGDVCLTLIQSQRLLGVSAPTICVCMCTACFPVSVFMLHFGWSLASTKITVRNPSGKGRGVK